jgi:hypothetical protein
MVALTIPLQGMELRDRNGLKDIDQRTEVLVKFTFIFDGRNGRHFRKPSVLLLGQLFEESQKHFAELFFVFLR